MKTGELLGKETEGVNQILPHKHKCGVGYRGLYEQGVKNNWGTNRCTNDKRCSKLGNRHPDDALSEDERLVIKRCLGFFAGSESLVANNLMTLSQYITDPESTGSIWQGRMYEECLHNHTGSLYL